MSTTTDREKKMVSVRLSQEARDMLDRLSAHHGIDRTAAIEMAIRDTARRALAPPRKR